MWLSASYPHSSCILLPGVLAASPAIRESILLPGSASVGGLRAEGQQCLQLAYFISLSPPQIT